MTTPKQTVQVYLPALKAVSRMMAKADIRYYLNGVHVEATAKETVLVTTDGHRLLAIRREAENTIDAPVNFIIPGDVVKLMLANCMAGGRSLKNAAVRTVPVELRDGPTGQRWAAPMYRLGSGCFVEFEPVAGKFPNWRKVIPKKIPANDKPTQFRPQNLVDFEDAARDLGNVMKGICAITALHDGEMVVIHTAYAGDTGYFGVMMGLRDCDAARFAGDRPAWLALPEAATPELPAA
ncbi:DNA polymerase III subunit beta family protein [Geminicoccus flavidas]|uniref:DNA polymerase III subunit beta family protein n=1 Tax=Geminicoccus flavidas TaxID=2506407 RepID=UPI0013572793|nr:hypothetical protein [Geminicoccus flavidas]